LMRREEGMARSFDDLASGLDTGAISRGRVIKLVGAALVASALGFVGAREADAAAIETQTSRRRCNQKGGDFCRNRAAGPTCKICCGTGDRNRRPKACCGQKGCNCCRRNQTCKSNGRCE
jgi:hypothetical protein